MNNHPEYPLNPLTDQETMNPFHRFDHPAMNTQFEILINHPDGHYASQAAHEAFILLEHLEYDLSRFISNSDISRINHAPGRPVLIGEYTAECLQMAQQLEKMTLGYFNIAIGTLTDHQQTDLKTRLDSDLKCTFDLDMAHFLASVPEHMTLDLGGIAKGYAVDKMVVLLKDWEIDSALIHGGHSTVYAYGSPSFAREWPVSVHDPFGHEKPRVIDLTRGMGASGLEKGFHIINPKTGKPAAADQASWAFAPTATEADALSTAFLLMTDSEARQVCASMPGYGGLKMRTQEGRTLVSTFGDFEA
jgi:thiamine biosynthesis lipoprotein